MMAHPWQAPAVLVGILLETGLGIPLQVRQELPSGILRELRVSVHRKVRSAVEIRPLVSPLDPPAWLVLRAGIHRRAFLALGSHQVWEVPFLPLVLGMKLRILLKDRLGLPFGSVLRELQVFVQ